MGFVTISITCHNWSAFRLNVVTKTKVIPTANRGKENSLKSQKEFKVKITKLPQSAGKRLRPSREWFQFASDWLREWREFCGPIAKRSKAKTLQSWIIFDVQFTIVLLVFVIIFKQKNIPLLVEHLDHQWSQKMLGCDDPTKAVEICTNPWRKKMYINSRPCLQEVHDMTLKVKGQTVQVGKKFNCLNKIDAENKIFCYRIRCEFVVNQEVWLRTHGSLFPQTTVWRKLQHHFPGVKFQKPV